MYFQPCLRRCRSGGTHSPLGCWCSARVVSTWPSRLYIPCPPLSPPSPTDGAQSGPGVSADARDASSSAAVCLESQSSSAHSPPHFPPLESRRNNIFKITQRVQIAQWLSQVAHVQRLWSQHSAGGLHGPLPNVYPLLSLSP